MATVADVDAELDAHEALLADDAGGGVPVATTEITMADEGAPPSAEDDGNEADDDEQHPRRQHATRARIPPKDEDMNPGEKPSADGEAVAGKRRIIRRELDLSAILPPVGIDPLDPAEAERRRARAAKFAPEPEDGADVKMDDDGASKEATEEAAAASRRAERAKKFGLTAPEPEMPVPARMPLVNRVRWVVGPGAMYSAHAGALVVVSAQDELEMMTERAKRFEMNQPDPLTVVDQRAGKKGYWEPRRNALPSETPRTESIYAFGTDKLSTNELLLLFMDFEPKWVEWINDSSANVVFADGASAAKALEGATELLWAPAVDEEQMTDGALGPDGGRRDAEAVRAMMSWRTLPAAQAHGGKGLQLLFRLSSEQDVKPEVRRPSRWYGETERKTRGRGWGRSGRRAPPPRLLVAVGPEPPSDLRQRLGKRSRTEEPLPPSEAQGMEDVEAAEPDAKRQLAERPGGVDVAAPATDAAMLGAGDVSGGAGALG